MVRLVLLATAALAGLARFAEAKAVFSHYMLGSITEDHAKQDIDDAMKLGIDAFALNVGDATLDWVGTTLGYLFSHAEAVGFKLYISMDVYAAGDACYKGGNSCNGPFDYQYIWDRWKGSSAYYLVDGKPLISTFSSGGFENDTWIDWKEGLANDMYFMPDFDETEGYYDAAEGWWNYWGPVVDGIFSWESAWPERGGFGGKYPGDISVDVPVVKGAHSRNRYYMMGLSPLQYKDSYGANVYRAGDLNLVKRMENILAMEPQPDFVQFQTWNDGPEAHYIGTLWPEQNTDSEPWFYANQDRWDHTGWQPLVASFIAAYKRGATSRTSMRPPDGNLISGAAWHKTILVDDIVCPYDGQSKYYSKPDGFDDGVNYLYWALVLSPDAPSGYTVVVEGGDEDHTQYLSTGLNYGYSAGDIKVGSQRVLVKDAGGTVVMTATGGMCVSGGCPSYIYNSNYQVLPFEIGAAEKSCKEWPTTDPGDGCTGTCSGTTPTTGDDWTHVECTNPGVTNAANDSSFRWNMVYAEEAWNWAIGQWTSSGGSTGNSLQLVEQLSNYWHGPENLACDTISDNNPCGSRVVMCDEVTRPAGYLILNSLETVYRGMDNLYEGLHDAKDNVEGDVGALASTFAPVPKESLSLKLALDILGLGFALVASPMWNSVLKGMPYFAKNGNTLGTLKDWVNPIVSNSITIAKDTLGTDSNLGTTEEITTRLEYIVDHWQEMVVDMDKQLFNGSDSSNSYLHSAITDGQLLESSYTSIGKAELIWIIKRALFANIIPFSWQISSGRLGPVVINSKASCDGTPEMAYVDTETSGNFSACIDGTRYYLLGTIGESQDCREGEDGFGTYCYANMFSMLSGEDKLDGNNWGGITVEDLINGAVNGYKANGNKNGWAMLDPGDTLSNSMELVNDLEIRAPGIVNLPVCEEREAYLNWQEQDYPDKSKMTANWPCN